MPHPLRVVAVLFLAAFSLVPSTARAQASATGRITGLVLDSASGRPLAAVQVVVAGTRLGGSTNDLGRFVIANVPAGTVSLETRRVGYRGGRRQNVGVTAGGTDDVEFRLTTIALTLEAVVTTGVVDPTSGTRVPFTVGRVNSEDAPVPAANAIETIQGKVAGVSVTPGGQTGPQPAVTVTEMNLLKAEALIRLNRAAEAVPLINLSRVAQGQLPPVTVDGPTDEPGCVPRKLSGACGSLWDALRYEKRIEGFGVDGVTAFLDARGWQTLSENTLVQLPIPGRELGVLQRPLYSYGGPGGLSSAPAPDPERCPVALARCP